MGFHAYKRHKTIEKLNFIINLSAGPSSHWVLADTQILVLRKASTVISKGPASLYFCAGFPDGSDGKNLPAVQETRIQPPGQGSLGEGTGNPLQWVLENSMDKELGELYNS